MLGVVDITRIVEEKIAGTDIFIVEIKVTPGKIHVFLDKHEGITIGECSGVARHIVNTIEPTGILETHDLDVSSPGLEEPLRVFQQYQRRVGREVSVKTLDGSEKKGELISVTSDNIEVKETVTRKENKKKVTETTVFMVPFDQIKETKLVLTFKS